MAFDLNQKKGLVERFLVRITFSCIFQHRSQALMSLRLQLNLQEKQLNFSVLGSSRLNVHHLVRVSHPPITNRIHLYLKGPVIRGHPP